MLPLRDRISKLAKQVRGLSLGQKRVLALAFAGVILLTGVLVYQNYGRGSDGAPNAGDSESARNRFGAKRSYSRIYYVSPNGQDGNDGTSADKPMQSIDKALSFAEAGDTIELADGDYYQTVTSVKDGQQGAPIILRGSRRAVVRGTEDFGRVMEIRHSYITLQGFAIDGQHGDGNTEEDFRDKLLYVIGNQPKRGVEGLKVHKMLIQNAGGECVRLRYFARNNEISESEIRNCGVQDFRFDGGSKNGEGIYIGTAPEQRADGKNPTDDVDVSSGNVVRNNLIETYGNECVDIKEGATGNIVEHNVCRHQQDPESAGFDARGSGNTFRYNVSSDNVGAGFRLGGDAEDDGIKNNIYGNTIANNKGGAVKVMREPQGDICDNKLENNSKKSGDYDVKPDKSCGN